MFIVSDSSCVRVTVTVSTTFSACVGVDASVVAIFSVIAGVE